MKNAYFDIETTAIPASGVLDVETIHCLCVSVDNDEPKEFLSHFLPVKNYGGSIRKGIKLINSCDAAVGHNINGFDIPVIEMLIGKIKTKIIDTFTIAEIMYSKDDLYAVDVEIEGMPKELWGSFSLDAFGYRMGFNKFKFNDWNKLTSEMVEYCSQDVKVTRELYLNMLDHDNFPSDKVLEIENKVMPKIVNQQYYGFYFHKEKAEKLLTEMRYEQMSIALRLKKQYRPLLMPNGPIVEPKVARRNKLYVKDTAYKRFDAIHYAPFQYKVQKNGTVRIKKKWNWTTTPHKLLFSYTDGEYQKLKLTPFDPGSRHKIRHWLKKYHNFEFSTYTEKGTPKVEAEELASLGTEGADMKRYLKLVKDISQLEGLINAVREDSTITSRINTNGTITGRFTSSSVNLNQIPAQQEFRELFDAPEGWTFVGTDFDGQENVNLAEVLWQFDEGRLNDIIVSGNKETGTDLHSLNAKATGLHRNDSKPLWFGFLYGSSSTLTGYTLLGNKDYSDYTEQEWKEADTKIQKRLVRIGDDWMYPVKSGQSGVYVPYTDQLIKQAIFGKHMQERLIKSTNGLAELVKHLESIVEETGGITTLGGRFIPVSSSHKALNYFCQGQGAEAMKYYIITIHEAFEDAGLVHGEHFIQQACIYDELDFIVRDDCVAQFSKILHNSYEEVSRRLNMKTKYSGEVMVGNNWWECH